MPLKVCHFDSIEAIQVIGTTTLHKVPINPFKGILGKEESVKTKKIIDAQGKYLKIINTLYQYHQWLSLSVFHGLAKLVKFIDLFNSLE